MIKGILIGIVVSALAAVALWLGVAYSGVYNIAASDWHADTVRWTMNRTMHSSVSSRAPEIELPETVPDEVLAQGAKHYDGSCIHCHGAPGEERSAWAEGMRPEPPHLAEAATEWEPGEIHWIVENGIKMTGMPAFGGHHGPEEIDAITAFVSRLPGLTAEDYAALTGGQDQQN
jgi:mono/diheme cytochrome c family protein